MWRQFFFNLPMVVVAEDVCFEDGMRLMAIFFLKSDKEFPPAELAEKDGLLAVGGDLSPDRLLSAYRSGIFPWYNPGSPILWWSPDPRFVIEPSGFHVPKRLERVIRQEKFRVTFDKAFEEVIRLCAHSRSGDGKNTWLTQEMIAAYIFLHKLGLAHSAEAWAGEELAGGLYGVVVGRLFSGESMFAKRKDASKAAFVQLVRTLFCHGFELIDCQIYSEHLGRFGAKDMKRKQFISWLTHMVDMPVSFPDRPIQ